MAHCVGLPPPNTNRFEIWCVFRVQTQVACSRPCVALIPEFPVTTTCYRGHGAFVQSSKASKRSSGHQIKVAGHAICTQLFGASGTQVVQYTPWKLTMYGKYWIILVYDQRFHQEMMAVEGKCLHGACTTHGAFLDSMWMSVWCVLEADAVGREVCARCKIENPLGPLQES